jgi:hypothetical protein
MRHITFLLLKKWDGRRGLVKIFALDNALRLLNTGEKEQATGKHILRKKRAGARWRLTVGTTAQVVGGGVEVTLISGRLRDLLQQKVSHSAVFVCLQ